MVDIDQLRRHAQSMVNSSSDIEVRHAIASYVLNLIGRMEEVAACQLMEREEILLEIRKILVEEQGSDGVFAMIVCEIDNGGPLYVDDTGKPRSAPWPKKLGVSPIEQLRASSVKVQRWGPPLHRFMSGVVLHLIQSEHTLEQIRETLVQEQGSDGVIASILREIDA